MKRNIYKENSGFYIGNSKNCGMKWKETTLSKKEIIANIKRAKELTEAYNKICWWKIIFINRRATLNSILNNLNYKTMGLFINKKIYETKH